MLQSFFLNESGFVAPWTALSWSWIVGILAGTATLLGAVTPALADVTCKDDCWGIKMTLVCAGFDSCTYECTVSGNTCTCDGECS